MIHHEIKQKPIEYIVLAFIFLVSLILFFIFRTNSDLKRWVVYLMSAGYFFWSLYHHYKRGDLHLSIIVEYLLFALFAIVLISATLCLGALIIGFIYGLSVVSILLPIPLLLTLYFYVPMIAVDENRPVFSTFYKSSTLTRTRFMTTFAFVCLCFTDR